MKKIAVVCSGWHFPLHFYENISTQILPNDWSMDMFCVSHRDPQYSEIEKKDVVLRGNRKHLDEKLYSKIASIKEIEDFGWVYKEYPNTVGDWGCSNQWLDDYDYKDYELMLFTHDDNLILKNDWFKKIIEHQSFNEWEIWTNGIGAPVGMLRGSCEFFKKSIIEKIGGKFDLSMVKLTRVGEKFGNRDVQQVNDWNNTVYPLMNFIIKNGIKVFHESKYYRVSEFCVEGERGFISGTQSSNISSENNGLEYYKLI
jgi:hypothetical protein